MAQRAKRPRGQKQYKARAKKKVA
ncbi:uncharacterized protein G2W53_016285 [Senna tora]|uniref:Uncharacterized protein n=1 Tax=Senna tora TaxID=362788 RepID=A0A834TQH7_9FABA|nr:uncharacterized protein G2W53_016285 [Senna tora]